MLFIFMKLNRGLKTFQNGFWFEFIYIIWMSVSINSEHHRKIKIHLFRALL